MEILTPIFILLLCYMIGSIPNGLIVVKIARGQDIRNIESGRTGGTNTMRAAGVPAGIITVFLDAAKGAVTGYIVSWLAPGEMAWLRVAAALMAIIGHNYSIFMIERNEKGRIRFRGGAGGATSFGGAFALWPPIALIILPLCVLVFLFVGYASVTTMSIPLISIIIFAIRAMNGEASWIYVLYGLFAEIIILWALRPNLIRLRNGTERLHGLRAYWKKNKKETTT